MQNLTLLLNADYLPLKLISWQEAVIRMLDGRVEVVDVFDEPVRSQSLELKKPAVVRMVRWVKPRSRVRYSRLNVLARDGFQCLYCGVQPKKPSGASETTQLTVDHVVPRAHATAGMVRLPDGRKVAVTSWENTVTACRPCNVRKADKTLSASGMKLSKLPTMPTQQDIVRISIMRASMPEVWRPWLPFLRNEADGK